MVKEYVRRSAVDREGVDQVELADGGDAVGGGGLGYFVGEQVVRRSQEDVSRTAFGVGSVAAVKVVLREVYRDEI